MWNVFGKQGKGVRLKMRLIPEQADLRGQALDVIVLFVADGAALRRGFAAAARRLSPAGRLWVACSVGGHRLAGRGG